MTPNFFFTILVLLLILVGGIPGAVVVIAIWIIWWGFAPYQGYPIPGYTSNVLVYPPVARPGYWTTR